MTQPTGWQYHVCEHQFVYALKGWVELEFENGEMYRLEAGDSVYIPGGVQHNELRTSDDLEILISRQANDRESIEAFVNKSGRAYAPSRVHERPHPHFLRWHRDNCFKR